MIQTQNQKKLNLMTIYKSFINHPWRNYLISSKIGFLNEKWVFIIYVADTLCRSLKNIYGDQLWTYARLNLGGPGRRLQTCGRREAEWFDSTWWAIFEQFFYLQDRIKVLNFFFVNLNFSLFTGHDKHVMTSYCSMDSIFKFFSEKLLAFAKKSEL